MMRRGHSIILFMTAMALLASCRSQPAPQGPAASASPLASTASGALEQPQAGEPASAPLAQEESPSAGLDAAALLDAPVLSSGDPEGWSTAITLENAGSRSESRSHRLLWKGRALPDVFEEVVAGGTLYRFRTRTQLWGDDGYVPQEGRVEEPVSPSYGFSTRDAELGYYLGDERKEGTPPEWFHGRRGDLAAFIDPARVDEFLEEFRLEAIERNRLF